MQSHNPGSGSYSSGSSGSGQQFGSGQGYPPDNTQQQPASTRSNEMLDQAKQTAGGMVEQAKEQVSSRLTDQISQTAEGLHYASEELRRAGQQLRQREPSMPIAQYADRAAEQIDRVSSYLRNKDLDMLANDVQRFAREKPAMFIGSAFGIGLVAARFLKSSPQSTGTTGMGDYGRTQQMPRAGTTPNWGNTSSETRWDQSHPTYRTSDMGSTPPPMGSTSSPGWSGTSAPSAPTTHAPASGSTTSSPSTSSSPSSLPASSPQQPNVSTPGTSRPSGLADDEGSDFRQSA